MSKTTAGFGAAAHVAAEGRVEVFLRLRFLLFFFFDDFVAAFGVAAARRDINERNPYDYENLWNFKMRILISNISSNGRDVADEGNVGWKKFHTYFSFKFTSLLHQADKQLDVLAFHTNTLTTYTQWSCSRDTGRDGRTGPLRTSTKSASKRRAP